MFTHESENELNLVCTVNSTVLLKLKDFSTSQAVIYTVKVAISRKRCKLERLLVVTTDHE